VPIRIKVMSTKEKWKTHTPAPEKARHGAAAAFHSGQRKRKLSTSNSLLHY